MVGGRRGEGEGGGEAVLYGAVVYVIMTPYRGRGGGEGQLLGTFAFALLSKGGHDSGQEPYFRLAFSDCYILYVSPTTSGLRNSLSRFAEGLVVDPVRPLVFGATVQHHSASTAPL